MGAGSLKGCSKVISIMIIIKLCAIMHITWCIKIGRTVLYKIKIMFKYYISIIIKMFLIIVLSSCSLLRWIDMVY